VGPRAGLDSVGREKSLHCPCRESSPGRPARSVVSVLFPLKPVTRDERVLIVLLCFTGIAIPALCYESFQMYCVSV
jgi:hypothetical protein